MATTTNLSVTLLESSQSQKEITMNEALQRIDAAINSHALDKDIATPPNAPTAGDMYIVAASPTGDWENKAGELAYFQQIWHFIVPNAGLVIWVADEAKHYVFNGTSWEEFVTGGTSTAAASGESFRNVLMNGDFEFWQRGDSFIHFNTQYGADRWVMRRDVPGSANISKQETTGLSGFRRAMRVRRNSGDTITDTMHIEQSVEARNAVRLQGKQVTLSFYVRMGGNFSAANLSVALITGTADGELAIGAGFTGQATLSNLTASNNTAWQRVTHTATMPSSATQLSVRFSYVPTGIAGAEDWFEITGVQLEAAAQASVFEHADYSIGLLRCQRYFEKSFTPDTVPIRNSGDTANAARVPQLVGALAGMYSEISFTVEKRTPPSITFYNPSANNAHMRNIVNNQNTASTTALSIGTKGMAPFCVTPAGSSAGQQLLVHYAADAELY